MIALLTMIQTFQQKTTYVSMCLSLCLCKLGCLPSPLLIVGDDRYGCLLLRVWWQLHLSFQVIYLCRHDIIYVQHALQRVCLAYVPTYRCLRYSLLLTYLTFSSTFLYTLTLSMPISYTPISPSHHTKTCAGSFSFVLLLRKANNFSFTWHKWWGERHDD